MTDEDRKLRDLLASSPLEAGRPERPAGPGRWIVAGIVAGGLVVIAAYAVGRSTDAAVTTTTAAPTSSVTTTTDRTATAEFPPGFGAIDDLVAIRPERVARTADELFVTFTVAVRRGLDPVGTAGFRGGDLVLEVDPPVRANRLIFDPLVGGVFTAVFPYTGDVAPETMVTMSATWDRSSTFLEQHFENPPFPFEADAVDVLELDQHNGLSVDVMSLGEDGGELRWSLNGEADGAIVSASVTITESFNDVLSPIYMFDAGREPSFAGPGFGGFVPTAAEHELQGVVELSPPSSVPDPAFAISVFWEVSWVKTSPVDVRFSLGTAASG